MSNNTWATITWNDAWFFDLWLFYLWKYFSVLCLTDDKIGGNKNQYRLCKYSIQNCSLILQKENKQCSNTMQIDNIEWCNVWHAKVKKNNSKEPWSLYLIGIVIKIFMA